MAKENIVTVFRNGEKEQYQLAPELYRAVKAMDKEVTNKIAKLARNRVIGYVLVQP